MSAEDAVNNVAAEMEESAETSRLLGMFTPDRSSGQGYTWEDGEGTKRTGGWYRNRYGDSKARERTRKAEETSDDTYMNKGRYKFFKDGMSNYPTREELASMGPLERVQELTRQFLPHMTMDHLTKEAVDAEKRYTSERLKANEEHVRMLQEDEQDRLFGLGSIYSGSKVPRPAEPYEYDTYQQRHRRALLRGRMEHMQLILEAQQKQQQQRGTAFLNNRASANMRNNIFAMGENTDPKELPELSKQVESMLHTAARDIDNMSDPFIKDVARYGILGDSDPQDSEYVRPVDPKWATLKEYINYARQIHMDDPQVWSKPQLREIWARLVVPKDARSLDDSLDMLQFTSYEDFFRTVKDLIGRNSSDAEIEKELVTRLQNIYPQFTEGALRTMLIRILDSLLHVGKVPRKAEIRATGYKMDSNELVIQSITDKVTDGGTKFSFIKFAEMAGQPMPKMAAVYDSIEALSKRRVRERQFYAVVENMRENDPRLAPNPIAALYEALRPIHDPSVLGSMGEPPRKVFEPEIINGVATGVGKRKSSIAIVKVKPGNGLFVINGRDYLQYFTNPIHKIKVALPLKLLDIVGQFDIDVTVHGGGTTGQVDAIIHGLSRALPKFIPEFGYALARNGFMHRDARVVERKKPGRKKARKKFQWVKR